MAWIHRYERIAWIPVLISFLVALGVGGKRFSNPEPLTLRLQPFSICILPRGEIYGYCYLNSITIYIRIIYCNYTVVVRLFFPLLSPCFRRGTFGGIISNKPLRIHAFVSSAILIVFSFNELRKLPQMCRDFENTRSTETLVAGMAR